MCPVRVSRERRGWCSMAGVAELELNRETINFIIDKAREFQVSEGMTPDDDAAGAPDGGGLGRAELHATINDLEPDQQICLVALMWLGRGDFALEEWEDALAQATDAHNARTAEYLIATPLLSDYLEEGLNLHGYESD